MVVAANVSTKEMAATGGRPLRFRVVRLLTFLLATHDSQRIATVRSASSPTYR